MTYSLVALIRSLAHRRFEQLIKHVIPFSRVQLAQYFEIVVRATNIAITPYIEAT
ncbi:hypothetical protein D3C77_630990 [compost metagenome]